MAATGFSQKVFAVVAQIPRGRVASYGLVGEVAGFPRSGRQVGMVMRLGSGIPWWRVIGADGRVVIANPALRFEQIQRLEAEGVEVSAAGRVDMERFMWRPRRPAPPRARSRPRR